MTKSEIIATLERISEELDAIQETDLLQDAKDPDLMEELGEAIGHLDNLIDSLGKLND